MECPKCGYELDDKAMVCPNCKKVLKLACPICKTINTTNTCKSCGYVIISKCNNCGKINQTYSKKCKKCGFDTEKSVIMNESNTDNFATLIIDFPNMADMKRILGSVKLYNKFKINLDKIIADYVKAAGLRRQIIDNRCVIRCNRDYTFNSSVYTAIKAAIDLLNLITAMNCKLTKKKQASIRCNMLILQRNVEDDPNVVDYGVNISLLYQNSNKNQDRILNTFQILADENVSDVLTGEYKVSRLNSVMVEDKMVSISEIDVKEMVKVEYPEEESDEIKVPNFVQNMLVEQDKLDGEALNSMDSYGSDPDAIYDIDTINFDEIKCEFLRTESTDVLFHISNIFQSKPKSIVALKTSEMYKPYTLKVLNAAAETGYFENIISLTCYDEMKYAPFSFFRELISAIFNYTVSQKLFLENDFSMFASIDPDGLIRDLITMQKKRDDGDNIATRYVYFDIFLTLMQIIPKTLIFVEDFEKIDDSSYEVVKYLLKEFENLDISFLMSYDKEFSLHKDCHFLLMQHYYTEITLKPASFEKIIEDNKVFYKDIMSDFYFQRIAKYSCGSSLFIDIAVQYLIESGVYEADESSIQMVNPKTIIIPSNLDKLVSRRLQLLQDDTEAMKMLTSIVLLGTRVDLGTIKTLGYENCDELLVKLAGMGYIYEYNECIYFPNYNLLRRNLLSTISSAYLQEVAADLFDKVLDDESLPSPIEAYLYKLLGEKEKECKEWEQLAEVDLAVGDFSAYICSAERILEILNENDDIGSAEEIDEYKKQIYENISENLFDYVPDKSAGIAEATLASIEQNSDTENIIKLCNKMIDGAIKNGNYNHALDLMHKVLALLPSSSINPQDSNFNKYFFLMSVIHVQILFNIGAFPDCLDVGYKILNVINDNNIPDLKPDYFTDEDFRQLLIDTVGYVALTGVLLLNTNTREFFNIVNNEISFIPQSYELFVILDDLIHGNFSQMLQYNVAENDRFGWALLNIINAFSNVSDNKFFAENVYKAKVAAKNSGIAQIELLADLLIAYAYLKNDNYKKTEYILYRIIKETSNTGMTAILFAAWYVMGELHIRQKNFDIAYGIVNNSLIQLEKNNNVSAYILMLFKYSMFKIMMFKKQYDKAQICIAHAQYIANKYSVNINFDIEQSHYESAEDPNENDLSVNPITDDSSINFVSNAGEIDNSMLDTIYPQEEESEG